MPDVWSTPAKAPEFSVGTILLLTDGSLFAQDDYTVNWWRLWPDAGGDYAKGRWTAAAPARLARRYFAAAVLADGRVFVAGGKGADPAGRAIDLCAAEIYDPVADGWSELPVPSGWAAIGNAPCCVLPNGCVLLGNSATGDCAIYDPETNIWRSTGGKRNGRAAEESWTLLPDGSVLAVDCFGAPQAERFLDDVWTVAAPPPAALIHGQPPSMGPAVLRPDGTVFVLGDSAATAVFRADRSAWDAGPALPPRDGQALLAKDAPACLLPDGRVLFVAAFGGAAASKFLGGRCVLLTYDGAVIAALSAQPATADVPPQWIRLLVLPTGQVLLASSRSKLEFLTPGGKPDDAWRPVVAQLPRQVAAGRAYVLQGRRLNGLSQGSVFGDDAGMATNYPLVRLRQTVGTTTRVAYCRTYGHSSMGVAAPVTDLQTTGFTLPADVPPGPYLLEVVVNGIASEPQPVTVSVSAKVLAERAAQDTDAEAALQSHMFWCDLNEVHMLMDYISGRTEKSLTKLVDVPNLDKGATTPLAPQEAVHRVCLIRFPPTGSVEEKADQAALLLLVKDRLNALASPARGLTIAFTSMFAAITNRETMAADSPRPDRAATDPTGRGTRKRYGFAMAAYPNLEVQAKRFRGFFKALPWITAVWFLLTALTSWDVLISSQTFQKALAEFQALPNDSVNEQTCQIKRDAKDGKLSLPPTLPAAIAPRCATLLSLEQTSELPAAHSYAARITCADIFIGPASLVHPVGWAVRALEYPFPSKDARRHWGLSGQPPGDMNCGSQGSCEYVSDVTDFAGSVINVFSNNILPMMFGLLGTLCGLMRSITAKVRDSTLSPRDYRLSLSLLPMGVVAGLTVGLIISPDAGSSGAGTVGTLSATALAFLAGYGAEFYFNTLDVILMRIFHQSSASSPGAAP